MMMRRRTKTTPNQTTNSIQRSSENPTNSPHAAQLSPRKLTSPRAAVRCQEFRSWMCSGSYTWKVSNLSRGDGCFLASS